MSALDAATDGVLKLSSSPLLSLRKKITQLKNHFNFVCESKMWFQLAHAQLLKFRENCFFSYRPAGGCPAFNSLSLSFGGEDIFNGKKIKFADDNFVKASNLA